MCRDNLKPGYPPENNIGEHQLYCFTRGRRHGYLFFQAFKSYNRRQNTFATHRIDLLYPPCVPSEKNGAQSRKGCAANGRTPMATSS